jgi:LmbE family N-acetylglucosaminyl deacetylase
LYYQTGTHAFIAAYEAVFGELVMTIDGAPRRAQGWEAWAITTEIDCGEHWRAAWRAVACHRSQLPAYGALAALPEAQHRALWGRQHFYRAFSTVNGGRAVEADLFAGLR